MPRHGLQAPAAASTSIDVWIARTDSILKSQSTLQVLSAEDWNGFGQLRAPAARDSAMAARILLRLGLSRATDHRIAPRMWGFKKTSHGRPLLSNPADVDFSVSHVDEIVAVAVASGASLGIDIENVDQSLPPPFIANFLHSNEQTALAGAAHHQKMREFVRFWTKKEAYTKLVGLGHSIDFASLNCADRSICDDSTPNTGKPLHFESFYASVGYSLYHASLAVQTATSDVAPMELQIINVMAPDEDDHPSCAPVCT